MSSKNSCQSSLVDQLRALPEDERIALLATLTDEEQVSLYYDWEAWALPGQLAPQEFADGDRSTWLVMAGRGFGKTRCGAEQVRAWVRSGCRYVNFVGSTADDIRDVMVEGESGILAISPPSERPVYRPSKLRLEWPNGARTLLFSAEEPDRLRGKQHEKLWCDEVAAWRYEESWDQAMLGLRLGDNPQVIATTTPKPTKLIRQLMAEPTTAITRGTTYDNKANLAPSFYTHIIAKYQGTRLGRQELNAEVLDDNPGALWTRAMIDAGRISALPESLERIVVGVDPAVTSNDNSDETGIVTCGRDKHQPPHYYVIGDCSLVASPDTWAKASVIAYQQHQADRIIGEVNNGGDLVEAVIRHVVIDGKPAGQDVPYTAVHASRGKAVRAEPIAALYEQGRAHHVGSLGKLEDQMCVRAGTLVETARGQVRIEDITTSDRVMTRAGLAPVKWSGISGLADTLHALYTSCSVLYLTSQHPVLLDGSFATVASARLGQCLNVSPAWAKMDGLSRGVVALRERRLSVAVPVYNLSIADGYPHEFYANGILVHNCDWNPQTDSDSPDRMDALVWALTELSQSSGTLGLLDLGTVAGPEIKTEKQLMDKLMRPEVVKPAVDDGAEHCPQCQSVAIARLGNGQRCNSCGHQWGNSQKMPVPEGVVRK
jgi:phage terminase large subunit-like protein